MVEIHLFTNYNQRLIMDLRVCQKSTKAFCENKSTTWNLKKRVSDVTTNCDFYATHSFISNI